MVSRGVNYGAEGCRIIMNSLLQFPIGGRDGFKRVECAKRKETHHYFSCQIQNLVLLYCGKYDDDVNKRIEMKGQ